ncbi:Peptidase M24, catalytic core [Beggiatoa sp. PS]|nr:Peptidase M24, catalytic core [Beggiatoa sp. PS]
MPFAIRTFKNNTIKGLLQPFFIMNVIIKTAKELEKMRVAGRLAVDVLDMITPYVQAGITTLELDRLCHDYMVDVQKTNPCST